MPYFTRVQRRCWSLSLMVILLLHWAGGAMAAEVLCFEPDGKVVLEDAGHPCQDAAAEKAFGKPCIDLKVDNQESHAVAPANPVPHADLQPLAFIPVLFYRLEAPQEPSLVQPLATGPPISISPAAIRRTTVLLI